MGHTPGPWKWEANPKMKQVLLIGKGSRIVMDFWRYGMNSAAPVFRASNTILHRADDFFEVVPGREHHSSWYQTIDHPDARLISAAPDLLAACKSVETWLKECPPTGLIKGIDIWASDLIKAIAKAEGEMKK